MKTTTKNIILTPFNILYRLNPKLDLKLLFRIKQGYKLNLEKPKTYNEKIQWIKLYDHNELMPKCCDKYSVRKIVKELGCEEILNELLWEGFNPEDIPFDELPNKFVIKATHGSTFNIICTDKSKLNKEDTINTCKNWLKTKFIPCYGEWFYGIEKPRIIIEKYLESDDGLNDYKVFCFNGEPRFICLYSGRESQVKSDIYTLDWEKVPGAHMRYECSGKDFEKPSCLEEMVECARILSEPFLHARVDFYIVDNKVIFGEITFTNSAGFGKLSSYEFDLKIGEMLDLKNE